MASYDWLLGIGIMFGFPLIMSYLTEFKIENYMGFLTFFGSYVVWMGLLPLWILVIDFMCLLYFVIMLKRGR